MQKGHLDVGDGHQIYFEKYGNPKGVNVLFLHGGPGFYFSENDRQFFDPEIFNVIFFDQRGCGKSLPKGALHNNTTTKILEDISQLLDFFKIEKTILFGGSWGSSLAFLFAIKNPKRVNGMILRGIFPATRKAASFFENGKSGVFYPSAWKRYSEMVPLEFRNDIRSYYFKMLESSDPEIRKKYAYEKELYGLMLSSKTMTLEKAKQFLEESDFEKVIHIQTFFSKNDFFIPDNFIFENLEKIGQIPVSIIHGKFDMMCPPIFAFDFFQKLKNAKLFIVDAGHVSSEPEIKKKLIEELSDLASKLANPSSD